MYVHKRTDRLRTCALALISINVGRHNSFVSGCCSTVCAMSTEMRNRVDRAVKLHGKAATLRAVTIAVGADISHHDLCAMVFKCSHTALKLFTSMLWQAVQILITSPACTCCVVL